MGSLVDEGFIVLLGAGALYLISKAKEIPQQAVDLSRSLMFLPSVGLFPSFDFGWDPHWNMDAVERVQALTGHSGSDYGEDFILNGGHEQGLAEAGGIGGLGAQGIIDKQMGLSGIVKKKIIDPYAVGPPKPKKRRKTVYHNLFEDEDPAIGPMADHPVEKDPGEDTHGFAPSPVPDTTYQITGLGMFGDEDPNIGNYVEPLPKQVQTQPRQIASTNIPRISYGMFEDEY